VAVRGVLDKAPILQAEVAALTALLTVQERVVIDQSTKLEQAVQEARAAQQRWQNTFNASPVGLLLMDENTVIIAVNDVVTKLAAKNSAEMVNRQPGDALGCLHAAEHPRGCGRSSSCASCPIRAVIEGVLKTGQPAHGIEVQPVLVVGDVRVRPWLEISAEPVVIDARSHLIVSIADITWRKQAAQALRESEERFRVLFESSRDAIMTLGPPSWRFTSANPAALLLFGAKDTAEFAALGPWNLSAEVQPDGRPSAEKAREMIETAMREGVHFFEWMHKQLNGKEFPATVLLTRMDVGGQKLLQATVRDITVQKQTEEALQKPNLPPMPPMPLWAFCTTGQRFSDR
jgi:PAS domain S-box-containing protein